MRLRSSNQWRHMRPNHLGRREFVRFPQPLRSPVRQVLSGPFSWNGLGGLFANCVECRDAALTQDARPHLPVDAGRPSPGNRVSVQPFVSVQPVRRGLALGQGRRSGQRCRRSISIPDHLLHRSTPRLRAITGPSALRQTACLLGGLPNLHNPRHSDCKGRTTTGLSLVLSNNGFSSLGVKVLFFQL